MKITEIKRKGIRSVYGIRPLCVTFSQEETELIDRARGEQSPRDFLAESILKLSRERLNLKLSRDRSVQ